MPEYAPAKHTFRDRAKAQNLTTHQILNSNNKSTTPPTRSDVTCVGAGIHSLIYAIHAKKKYPDTSISVYEKQVTPGYKIGESALTPLGLWMVNAGIPTAVIIRIFGVKDGLAFYYFHEHGDPEEYGDFCANGPAATWVPTFQMERSISEMILTLLAQRLGVDVYHGTPVEIDATVLKHNDSTIKVKDVETQQTRQVSSKLVVDGTGRFRRLASKAARLERPEGWNTDAFWAYFKLHEDETEIAKELRCYESCNTNHICVPEGWAWVIRLPSWEGSSTPNLMDMLSYLLDLAEKDTPGDQYPSANKLAEMFDLKLQWVVSIGFALRTDTKYPADLTPYGTKEAEQKFNWIVAKYPKVTAFMKSYTLIEDLYGPKTTWFVRKQLSYRSPKAFGPGWLGVGDAVVFSNPLFSPGINANMSFGVKAAEMTQDILTTKSEDEYNKVMQPYADYAKWHGEGLMRLNKLNYVCMRHPKLGPVSNLWTYICGQGNKTWQRRREFNFNNQHELIIGWIWGAGEPVFVDFAEKAFKLLEGTPDEKVSDETVAEVLRLSDEHRRKALALPGSPYKNNWAGLLRFYDKNLERVEDKTWKDLLARRCTECGNWNLLREDWLLCVNCTHPMTKEVATIRLVGEDGLLHDPYA